MNKTLLTERRLMPEEVNAIIRADRKAFKKISKEMDKISKSLSNLLPKFQHIHSFNSSQVAEFSAFIDSFDNLCSNMSKEFENKINPETW